MGVKLRCTDSAMRIYFCCFLDYKIYFLNIAFDNEKNYFFNLGYFASIDIFLKVKCFTTVEYFEFTTNDLGWIIKLQFKVVKHELVGVHKNILIDLAAMKIDSPP